MVPFEWDNREIVPRIFHQEGTEYKALKGRIYPDIYTISLPLQNKNSCVSTVT